MNNIQGILEIGLFLIGMTIFIMSLIANLNKENSTECNEHTHSLDFLWIFHEEYYNDFGKSLCNAGRKLTALAVLLFILWLFQ